MTTRYVAYRGGAAQWPENSLTTFRNAIGLGARVLELDVHLTADGEIAVIHDPTLDRTTSTTGAVARCAQREPRPLGQAAEAVAGRLYECASERSRVRTGNDEQA